MIPRFKRPYSPWRDPAKILIAVNTLLFAVHTLFEWYGFDLFLHMSKINALIATGEVWRLLTATFAHANLIHLLSNMWGILVFWRINRPFYGDDRLLVIYFVAGIGGSLISYAFNPIASLGASGCLYGLFGANLYLLRRNARAYRRIFSTDILMILAINLILSFSNSGIDLAAHLGGLIAGYFTSAAVGVAGERWFRAKRVAMQLAITALIIGIFTFTTLRMLTPSTYIEAAQYQLLMKNTPGAIAKIEQGVRRFPQSPELKYILTEIRQLP